MGPRASSGVISNIPKPDVLLKDPVKCRKGKRPKQKTLVATVISSEVLNELFKNDVMGIVYHTSYSLPRKHRLLRKLWFRAITFSVLTSSACMDRAREPVVG